MRVNRRYINTTRGTSSIIPSEVQAQFRTDVPLVEFMYTHEEVRLVEFLYLVFTRMSGESYRM